MRQRIENARRHDAGFTLIELLVVVIIIGILAAIAIPTFLNQRKKAWQAQSVGDLHNAGIVAEDYFADNYTYAGLTPADLRPSDGDVLTVVSATSVNVCIEVDNIHLNGSGTADYHIDTPNGKPIPGGC